MICTEATGVYLKNCQFMTDDSNPVISIDNSQAINLDNITYNKGSNLLFKISGTKTENIIIKSTDTASAKTKVEFANGATNKSIEIK